MINEICLERVEELSQTSVGSISLENNEESELLSKDSPELPSKNYFLKKDHNQELLTQNWTLFEEREKSEAAYI